MSQRDDKIRQFKAAGLNDNQAVNAANDFMNSESNDPGQARFDYLVDKYKRGKGNNRIIPSKTNDSGNVFQAFSGIDVQSPAESAAEAYQILLKYGPQLARMDVKTRQSLQPLMERLRTSDRTANISDIESLLPALKRIQQEQLSPEEARIRDILSGQITSDLSLGETLSPEIARQVEQAARTAEVSRGISGGRGSANREAVKKALEGRRLKTERQTAASSFLAQEAAGRFNPVSAITGSASTALQSTPSSINAGSVVAGLGNQFTQQNRALNQDALAQDRYNLSLKLTQQLFNRYNR